MDIGFNRYRREVYKSMQRIQPEIKRRAWRRGGYYRAALAHEWRRYLVHECQL